MNSVEKDCQCLRKQIAEHNVQLAQMLLSVSVKQKEIELLNNHLIPEKKGNIVELENELKEKEKEIV